MAVVTITPQDVYTALSSRGYFVEEKHVPVLDDDEPTPDVHIPPEAHVPPDVHIPTEAEIPPDAHIPPPVIHIPPEIHVPPDIHISIPAAPEPSPYAKYLRFLPFLVVLVSEKHILDLRRVL